MPELADPTRIVASPTKGFFIHMLTRDIELTRAIVDLVDNCVDGAIRLRGEGRYDGLRAYLSVTPAMFRIADNCGGIEADLARDYAFMFGRPPDFEKIPHSIGQFGVGMKRALFKLGNHFRIASTAKRSRFLVDVDIDIWKELKDWDFHFSELEEGPQFPDVPEADRATEIVVDRLHDSVAELFKLENFIARLRDEITSAHQRSLRRGLGMALNGTELVFKPLLILHSDRLVPSIRQIVIDADTDSPVQIKIFAGIAESDPSEAGWYIFCNGRLILEADKTAITGWGFERERGTPRYHNQYAMSRGYVFFDSDDAGKLPWNTTKTGIDTDSPLYKSVLLNMITLMKPVTSFLNKLKEEKEGPAGDTGPLQRAIEESRMESLDDLDFADLADVFRSPKPRPRPLGPPMAKITYQRPASKVDQAKKKLKVRTNGLVGERTFDYYFGREVEE
jgi:hypothetical protein